jgi:solute:Na+ symporter, SSS family
MNYSVVGSFVFFTSIVAIISYFKTKKEITQTTSGLFFANRNNNFWVVGGALFLSNISANQFIGENESIFINNMSVISWGISSVLAMVLVSEFMLPIYFKTGALTIPDFLGQRYDSSTKRLVSLIFLLSYLVNLLPSALYGGAIAFNGLLDLFDFLPISYWSKIWITVWIIGVIGASYTILGGIRAISISDSVISLGLLIIGFAFPYFGFKYLGNGDWHAGLQLVLYSHQGHLNSIGDVKDEIPFSTIFTGMFIMNLYYWGMEQYIIQQALTAKNLSHSQKGMALACVGKLASPFLINVPGILSVFLYSDMLNTAEVFPRVVNDILPAVLTGLTAAIVLGAAITTFNAGLTSSSTLFILTFYKPIIKAKKGNVTEQKLIQTSKRFQIIVSLLAMFTAPFIFFSKTGFYTYLQQLAGMFSVPIFTIVLVAFLSKKASPTAAKTGIIFFMIGYILANYIFTIEMHYLHILGILFLVTFSFVYLFSKAKGFDTQNTFSASENPQEPWKYRYFINFILILVMILIFLFFSPLGIA